ncbi:hypothetical protein HYU92_06560 [Candidatus Curtissbacteria bacterium]|nr:hypothetical protein [Candidatus Curtissbacteria bacterium]
MKECLKPHPLLHSLSGVGLGLLLAGLVPSLAASGVLLGIILIVAGVGGEFMMKK